MNKMLWEIPAEPYWVSRKLDDLANQVDRISWGELQGPDVIDVDEAKFQIKIMGAIA
jgi:hypothetical protein